MTVQSEAKRAGRPLILVVTGDHTLPDPTKWDGAYSADDIQLHQEMRAALESLAAYEFDFLSEHARLLERLPDRLPQLVLNFCDTGFRNVATQEIHLPVLLEVLNVPYSGAPPAGMVLCYDKSLVRLVAEAHGIPTPFEVSVGPNEEFQDLRLTYPALIKPAQGDGSVGINRRAVVHSHEEAKSQLNWFRKELPGRVALVQEYLPGPEYGLALLGNPGMGFTAFPPLEVDFSGLGKDLPPILVFESKTGPQTPYDAVRIREAGLEQETLAAMISAAEFLFERLSCRDYARFDFRKGADGQIKLMEVNPNPAWSSAGKLALMAGFAGQTYPQLLEAILETALERVRTGAEGS